VLLITGKAGEGKTRLALELLKQSERDGWVGGCLPTGAVPATGEPPTALTHPDRPLLLVIDDAATRAAEIAALASPIARARSQVPVRLLLLARTGGQPVPGVSQEGWWAALRSALSCDLPDLPDLSRPVRGWRARAPRAAAAATTAARHGRGTGRSGRHVQGGRRGNGAGRGPENRAPGC
jgi:hypothetical protein